jgi:hypothetical protein
MPNNALIELANQEGVLTVRETIDGLYDALQKSAAMSIAVAADEEEQTLGDFTAIEQRAMLQTEMLNQSKAMDFASVMLKGRILETISRESLHAAHPAGYATLEALAQDQGMSSSELSNTIDLTSVIFPWIDEHLDMSAELVYNQIGKSNLRELVPILKRVITLEEARGSVERSFNYLWNEMHDMLATAGQIPAEAADDDEQNEINRLIQNRIVGQLVEDGAIMTNADLRQRVRPERTTPVDAYIFHLPDGTHMMLSVLTDEQEQMVARRLHGYWDQSVVNIREDTRLRPTAGMRNLLGTVLRHIDIDIEE